MSNLGFQGFQIHSELNIILVDKLLKTQELCDRMLSIYPMRLHWSTLSGKRTNFYTYLATAQKSKYAVVPIYTEEEFHLFNSSVSLNGHWFSPNGAPDFEGMAVSILKVTTRNGQRKSRKRIT